jgi:hypothetical protein
MTVKRTACSAFVTRRVPRPRPKSPRHPSLSMICCAASLYVIVSAEVCLVVLSTRIEFDTQSLTHAAETPSTAVRSSLALKSPSGASGSASFSELKVRYHG